MSDSRALLLTDVVDSTQLNEQLGDAVMGPLWKSHDSSARDLMQAWRGQEVARSDGFLVVFESCRERSWVKGTNSFSGPIAPMPG